MRSDPQQRHPTLSSSADPVRRDLARRRRRRRAAPGERTAIRSRFRPAREDRQRRARPLAQHRHRHDRFARALGLAARAAARRDADSATQGGVFSTYQRAFRIQHATVSFDPTQGIVPTIDLRAVAHVTNPDPDPDRNRHRERRHHRSSSAARPTAYAIAFASDPPYPQAEILGLLVDAPLLGALSFNDQTNRRRLAGAHRANRTSCCRGVTPYQAGSYTFGQEAFSLLNAQVAQRLLSPLERIFGGALGPRRLRDSHYDYGAPHRLHGAARPLAALERSRSASARSSATRRAPKLDSTCAPMRRRRHRSPISGSPTRRRSSSAIPITPTTTTGVSPLGPAAALESPRLPLHPHAQVLPLTVGPWALVRGRGLGRFARVQLRSDVHLSTMLRRRSARPSRKHVTCGLETA